tara:strand:- start:832 stop:1074 length:243 start_codon:yes stop_codon:yes gene_type:complete
MTTELSIAWFKQDVRLSYNEALKLGQVFFIDILNDYNPKQLKLRMQNKVNIYQFFNSLNSYLDNKLKSYNETINKSSWEL